MFQKFRKNDAIFHDENSLMHTARSVQSWFEEHEEARQHIPWAAQLPDLSIIEIVVSFRR